MRHRVVVLALPGVVNFDLSIPLEVFGYEGVEDRYSLTICGIEAGPVASSSGLCVYAPEGIDSLGHADTVIVPGYNPQVVPPDVVKTALRNAFTRGARMVSLCTGAVALASSGLLDNRTATSHWRIVPDLAKCYPLTRFDPDVLYVEDGRVYTSAGIAAGIDLCLHIVGRDCGLNIAMAIARNMVVGPHRAGFQAQFLDRPMTSPANGVAFTCEWALGHLSEPLTVATLAEHAGLSPRSFARKFVAETGTTPRQWLTTQRIAEARRLLESTDLSVDLIASRSGLGSAVNMRLHFDRALGTTPTAYRRELVNRMSGLPPQVD